ncbi:MAG: extracellular solute-binding protein [Phycisphaerales bacterium]|nr:extracellular solute-binding protein [Planctomycetota bacterium]MCH8508326.1 extracellular solute-binding protein [Phycisphaerales bacterium]
MTQPLYRALIGVLLILSAMAGTACSDRESAEIKLELWTISLRPTFTDYMERLIESFEAEHPGVRVVWVDVPFSAVDRKLIAAAAANRAPDVVNLSDMMFARFAGAGAFLELSSVLEDDPEERYHTGALAVGRLGDGLYALPWYLTTQARIVNEGLLRDRETDPASIAADWPTLRRQAAEYHARTGGLLFTQPLGEDSQLPVMMLADGIVPFRTDADNRLRADLTRPEIVEWIRDWVDLYRSGAMPRQAATNGFEHLIEVFQEERVAVLNTGANFLGRVKGVSPRVYDRTEVSEPIVGALGRAHIAVMPICVSARTRHPEMAARLAWYLTSPENQLDFCRLAPILPSTPASLEDDFFAGPTTEEIEQGIEKIGIARAIVTDSLAEGVAFTPALECWPTLRRSFNEHIKRALLSDRPVERVLAEAERDWNRILDEADLARERAGSPPMGMDAIPRPEPVATPAPRVQSSTTDAPR